MAGRQADCQCMQGLQQPSMTAIGQGVIFEARPRAMSASWKDQEMMVFTVCLYMTSTCANRSII